MIKFKKGNQDKGKKPKVNPPRHPTVIKKDATAPKKAGKRK